MPYFDQDSKNRPILTGTGIKPGFRSSLSYVLKDTRCRGNTKGVADIFFGKIIMEILVAQYQGKLLVKFGISGTICKHAQYPRH